MYYSPTIGGNELMLNEDIKIKQSTIFMFTQSTWEVVAAVFQTD
jgi:hypothetical protein